MSELQGDRWGPTLQYAGAITQHAVAFAEHAGMLHMALRGYGPEDTCIEWYVFDGSNWHRHGQLHDRASSKGPALARTA
ncbi:hypothetical protein ACWIGW_41410 [Nocardia brasiliensis]